MFPLLSDDILEFCQRAKLDPFLFNVQVNPVIKEASKETLIQGK